ncbi:protein translocase subunit SecF [Streptomyces oceani]|uniref:Protein-export membrane protein SecF n=1 Tax=Streptomyces oceani TaxID=1075402 RepID=A0A1E7JYE2_9ACTN|nr:protein translocase subunit SecF [Streptomyces oceani]OEU96697.1 preprotein translocase subunit SecF [Streptomyces oceani]
MSRLGEVRRKLARGETDYDFVGNRKRWYAVTVLLVIIALAGLGVRGLQMGIDFQGGAVFTTPSTQLSVEDARGIAEKTSGQEAEVQQLGGDVLRIQVTGLDTEESGETRAALADEMGIAAEKINAELVGPSWGDQMTEKAFQGILIFLALVSVYLAITFEWRMAIAALVALLHDLAITVGVYAIVGFEVTPGTVVGILTILGYSLYDTVVVFDRVTSNTRHFEKQQRHTYGELANMGVNGTMVRSINTSVVALLPVGALLFIGSGLLGGGTLKDISLSLFIGLTAGTWSSVMIATPVTVDLKFRDPAVQEHTRRVLGRRAKASAGRTSDAGGAAPEDAHDDEPVDEDAEPRDAQEEPAGVGGQRAAPERRPSTRRQPAARNRNRGRPSGKRR